jgi:hypothetical protein
VLPQIAHHASPGALASGQEDGRDHRARAVGATLLLYEQALMSPRIVQRPSGPVCEHESVTLSR